MTKELYFSYSKEAILSPSQGSSLVVGDVDGELMKKSIITADLEKKELVPPASLSRYALQKQKKVYLMSSVAYPQKGYMHVCVSVRSETLIMLH